MPNKCRILRCLTLMLISVMHDGMQWRDSGLPAHSQPTEQHHHNRVCCGGWHQGHWLWSMGIHCRQLVSHSRCSNMVVFSLPAAVLSCQWKHCFLHVKNCTFCSGLWSSKMSPLTHWMIQAMLPEILSFTWKAYESTNLTVLPQACVPARKVEIDCLQGAQRWHLFCNLGRDAGFTADLLSSLRCINDSDNLRTT